MAPHSSIEPAPLSGMTVNERLLSRGLVAEFDTAARIGPLPNDAILSKVELPEDGADAIVDAILGNPTRYGI